MILVGTGAPVTTTVCRKNITAAVWPVSVEVVARMVSLISWFIHIEFSLPIPYKGNSFNYVSSHYL